VKLFRDIDTICGQKVSAINSIHFRNVIDMPVFLVGLPVYYLQGMGTIYVTPFHIPHPLSSPVHRANLGSRREKALFKKKPTREITNVS